MAVPGGRPRGRLARVPSPLLRAKLRVPTPPDHYVRRPRLLRLLDDAVRGPVTLVEAPAGAGKTVLVAGWIAESSAPAAWLSVDDADLDGAQFWSGVIAAIETIAADSADNARSMLQRSGPLTDVVAQLLDDLETTGGQAAVL